MKSKKKIHPSSFVAIKGQWSPTIGTQKHGVLADVEINVRWRDVRYFEKTERPPALPGYWLTVIDSGPGASWGKTNLYSIDEKAYNKLRKEIANVDFGLQDALIVKQIRETVQEEVAKKTKVNSSILSLGLEE